MNIQHITTDQNWQDETTTAWFSISGYDEVYDGDYGIVFSGVDDARLLNSDGHPVSGDNSPVYVRIFDALIDQANEYV